MLIHSDTCNGIPYVVIDDFYTKEELEKIFAELNFLRPNLLEANNTNAATDDNGLKTSKHGVFLDELFNHRNFSNILQYNRKQFSLDVMEKTADIHPWFRYIRESTYDSTLLSYYEDSDYYKAHRDSAIITTLHWFFVEPKMFEGGDLIIENKNSIQCRNNRVVFMPSCAEHEVVPIKMAKNYRGKGLGRYCCSTFINIKQ